jgi:multiple sugar transport system permease protein
MKKDVLARIIGKQVIPRIILAGMCLVYIMPFYWMLITSLKGSAELGMVPPTFWPHAPHFENFMLAVRYIPFFRYFVNTITIVVFSVIGAVITNSLVSYGISRINWPGRDALFYVILATMFIPFPVTLVALFDIFAKFHLINTYAPLALPYFAGSATYIFMMRQYLSTIPKEISDAGIIDGANEWGIFWRLTLPLMQPIIAVVAIQTAITSWNDFLTPLIYLQDQSMYTLSIGLQFFRAEHSIEYSFLMAASTLVALPVIVIFLIFQRFFIEGATAGAVKG